MKNLLYTLAILSISIISKAQVNGSSNLMRENGKIYVVIAVVLTILAGLILYLVRLDRKISKLEKNN